MRIFQITDATWKTKGFPYAAGHGPVPGQMPFLSAKEKESLEALWRIDPRSAVPGLHIDEKGSKWGDFLAYPIHTATSARVCHALEESKAKVLHKTAMPIGVIRSKKLKNIPPPNYFVLQFAGGVEVDWQAMGIEIDSTGEPIINISNPQTRIAKLNTWNGSDVFAWINWDATPRTMLCTEKIVELAEKEKWTNVHFDPVPMS